MPKRKNREKSPGPTGRRTRSNPKGETSAIRGSLYCEVSPDGRTSCGCCGERFEKGQLRVGQTSVVFVQERWYAPQVTWYHMEHFPNKTIQFKDFYGPRNNMKIEQRLKAELAWLDATIHVTANAARREETLNELAELEQFNQAKKLRTNKTTKHREENDD